MMMAYHDKKSLEELFMQNYRIYSISENFDRDFKELSNANALALLKIPKIKSSNAHLFKYI